MNIMKRREFVVNGLSFLGSMATGAGRYGDALKFAKKNTRAVCYLAEKNIAHRSTEWSGLVLAEP